MDSHIEIIARGLWVEAGRVLLCRSVKKGYCYLPGGHVEFDEEAKVALAREFVEEAGVEVSVGELALVTEGGFRAGKRRHHEVNLVFHVEPAADGRGRGKGESGFPPGVTSLEPQIAFLWADLDELDQHDIRPDTIRAFLVSLAGRREDRRPVAFLSSFTRQ